jgi:hypothetical protein
MYHSILLFLLTFSGLNAIKSQQKKVEICLIEKKHLSRMAQYITIEYCANTRSLLFRNCHSNAQLPMH